MNRKRILEQTACTFLVYIPFAALLGPDLPIPYYHWLKTSYDFWNFAIVVLLVCSFWGAWANAKK